MAASKPPFPVTADGRYFVVRGRLWRKSNPHLSESRRAELVAELMAARSALARTGGEAARKKVRKRIDAAKVALGERGPPWWADGAPDENRRMAVNTPYREWFLGLD